MYSSSNYLYRRPSNASDSSSATLTDDKCYGLTNSPQSHNFPYSSSYNNGNQNFGNYNNGLYNNGSSNYIGSSYYNAIDEEYKNLPYANSYDKYSNSNPLAINRNSYNYGGSYNNNYNYNNDVRYNNSLKYNYALGSSSFPTYKTSNFINNYENNRRNSHRRSLSVGNTPNNTYYDSDDGVYRNNNNDNYIYITRSSSTPSRHLRYNSGGSYSSSFYKRNSYNHTNPIDYLDLPVNNRDDYYGSRFDRKRRLRRNSKSGSDYYPFERKKSLLENLTSKFKKLRFGSDKYEDYYDDYINDERYKNLVRNNTLTNSLSGSMNNLDNQYNGYNNYDNNYYNNNYNNGYNNNYNNFNNNYNNNYNNNNDMYSYLNNSSNNDLNINRAFNNNRTYSDYTIQPPSQKLIKAPTIENTTTSSLSNYYNGKTNFNYNNNYNSWNNNNYSTNNLIDNQAFALRDSNDNIYNNNNYSSIYGGNNYSGLRRSSSGIFHGRHSRHNSYSGNDYYTGMSSRINDPYNNMYTDYNRSSRLYNTFNKSQDFQDDNYLKNLKNNVFVTNDNLASDDEANLKLSKYKLKSHRLKKSRMKEYVDSNYYSNNYDCNPKYYKASRQPSKVTFDRNVQYWSQ